MSTSEEKIFAVAECEPWSAEIARAVEAAGWTAIVVPAGSENAGDQPMFAAAEQAVAKACGEHDRVDVYVGPLAAQPDGHLADLDPQEWVKHRAELKWSVSVSRAIAAKMVERGAGTMVQLAAMNTFESTGALASALSAASIATASGTALALGPENVTSAGVLLDTDTDDLAAVARSLAALVVSFAELPAEDVAGRFFFATSDEVGTYASPMRIEATDVVVKYAGDADAQTVRDALSPLLAVGRS